MTNERKIHSGILPILAAAIGSAFLLTWQGTMDGWPFWLISIPFGTGTLGSLYFWEALHQFQVKYEIRDEIGA